MCDECFGPLEVEYDFGQFEPGFGVTAFRNEAAGIRKYAEFLPIKDDYQRIKIGDTPLIRAERLGAELGIRELYLKYEGVNASLSFKDRVVATALPKAKEFGFNVVACASTGNLANALAIHAASQGMETVIFVPEGEELGGITVALACGAKVIQVEGSYDDANRLCTEVQESSGWGVINGNLKPYYLEGAKTIVYEIMDEMRGNPPASIVVPVGGGGLLCMLWKGLSEMKRIGLIKGSVPALYAAQPNGCSPVVSALKKGEEAISPVRPDTVVGSIAIGAPPDGDYAKEAVLESGGTGEDVSDEEAIFMVRMLAEREGVISGGAGGVALGVLSKLVRAGKIDRDGPVVVIITDRGGGDWRRIAGRRGEATKVKANLTSFLDHWKE